MADNRDDINRIKAIAWIYEGKSLREIGRKLGVSKSLVGKWKKQHEANNDLTPKINKVAEEVTDLQKAEERDVAVSDRYTEYIDTLRTAKDRQGKWAGAITETGIRSLKFANKFLARVERKDNLTKDDLDLIKLVPTLLNSSASALKSAAEAEDRAYSLELIADKLNDLPKAIQANNRRANPRPVVAND